MAHHRSWNDVRGLPLTMLCAALLAGCQTAAAPSSAGTAEPVPVIMAAAEPAWRTLLAPADRDRLERLGAAWTQGLETARRAGFTRQIRAEGALLDPAIALPRATPAPGSYRCRLLRIGGTARRRGFVSSPSSFCFIGVEGPLLSLTRQTGAPRPGGYLYDDQDARQVFIGAAAVGREAVPPAYGDDPARNVAGVFERVGAFRYRLVIPAPADGAAALDVLELVPAVSAPA